ncbi:DUF1697 domain-containing protein [Pararhizobium sp. IMCC21322]|uniref:DUF1697 domain-containing protein n=1 Tax=Pararhizobium sp. IMCC21322 TaxID=3067903 RepID=UPI0027411B1B|nr:DUF1697 domain-containing protein [Pararhizobium sp. IMCC21322]
MVRYVALLRAVNVGGSGKLPMKDLIQLCTEAGFEDVQTYIASGNVVFSTHLPTDQAKAVLEARLETYAGRLVPVFIRTGPELKSILDANPFPDKPGNRTMVVFLDGAPPKDALAQATGLKSEEMRLGAQELYIHYGEGMGQSKLKIPAAQSGTSRNMNTVAKLVKMALNE